MRLLIMVIVITIFIVLASKGFESKEETIETKLTLIPNKNTFRQNDPEKITLELEIINNTDNNYYFYGDIFQTSNIEIRKKKYIFLYFKEITRELFLLSITDKRIKPLISYTRNDVFPKDENIPDSILDYIDNIDIKDSSMSNEYMKELYKYILDNTFYLHAGEKILKKIDISFLQDRKSVV